MQNNTQDIKPQYEYKKDKYRNLALLLDNLGLIGKDGFGELVFKIEDSQIVLIEKKEKIKP